MKVYLIGASFNTDNMGVGALTHGLIKSVAAKSDNDEIYLLDYGVRKDPYLVHAGSKEVTVRPVNLRFSKKIFLPNNIALLLLFAFLNKLQLRWGPGTQRCLIKNDTLARISEADIIGAISGGDSFSDIYGLARFFYVTLPQLLVLMMEKPLVLLPQTLGPYEGRVARGFAKYILKKAKLVYSRDYSGLREIEDMMGPSWAAAKLRFCYDVGFFIDPVRPDVMELDGLEVEKPDRPIVGLNVSGLLYMGGYTHDNMFRLRIDYRSFVRRLIEYLVKEKKATVLLIPHVFGGGLQSESDSAVCERIHADLKADYPDRLFLARGYYDQNEIKYVIGLCDLFIGSRMHACIAAVSQSIPAIPIAYSRKFRGVMETIGMDPYVADPRVMSEEQIMALIGSAYEDRATIQSTLQATMPQVRERVSNLFREIREELQHP